MVDSLKDNDSLDFHFVSSKEAKDGLKNGTYYMVITIPEDFRQTLLPYSMSIQEKWFWIMKPIPAQTILPQS